MANWKTLLWLDDCRDPKDKKIDWLVFSPIGRQVNVVWCQNYDLFCEYISNHKMPDAICFDHDLGEGPSGYDAAKFLVEYCMDNNAPLPEFASQSSNPTGRENIISLLTNFKKHYEQV